MAIKPALRVSPVAVVLFIVLSYLIARVRSDEEILRVKLEAEHLVAQRDSIRRVVEANTAIQQTLERERDEEVSGR